MYGRFMPQTKMPYRRLGRCGLQLSVLSFGSWVTFDTQIKDDLALDCMQVAHDAGCNFYDNAEAYAGGESEAIMGRVIEQLGWKRQSYVLSTKVFWGLDGKMPNMQNTLNRKYLHHAIEGCLDRLRVDFIDLLFCHRADKNTPIEETVWAMHDLIERGKVLYWGTSEWSADEIRAAWDIAERHHLHKPVMEQPQYNMIERTKVEIEFARLYDDIGLGLTTWSPLASGILTGKYRDGIPDDSRGALPGYGWLAKRFTDPAQVARVEKIRPIAEGLGCTMAQLAVAWCASNPNVTTVITGASKVSQVVDNFGALDVLEALTPEIIEQINTAVAV
jgi:voltage-dependent potassium channel beta subunit